MTEPKILIIGAGLAGLSLGQGLKQVGITFKIFERDHAASFRAQGYRIRVDDNALPRLLPKNLFEKFEATSAEVIPGGHRLDAMTGEMVTDGILRMPQRRGAAWNADRTVLRNVLLENLEAHVEFGKKLDRYELVEEGVVAHFTDGSHEAGSMIVGADGARSQVRHQMLPNHVLLDTEGRAVFGKTLIEKDTFDHIPPEIGKGICLIGPEDQPRMKLFCDVMRFDKEVGYDLPQDYIYWVLLFHKACIDKSDAELFSLSNVQSAGFAEELTSHWHEKIRSIVTRQMPEAASTLHFLITKPPIEAWKTDTRITLLGDAAHATVPAGGAGANVAFQDAADLVDMFRRGVSLESLGEYEQIMRDRCSEMLAQSGGAAGHFFGMKPIEELKPVSF